MQNPWERGGVRWEKRKIYSKGRRRQHRDIHISGVWVQAGGRPDN
jgi:queA: S-adenosylmethionine:tRNA ribosyltransferase-isomerase